MDSESWEIIQRVSASPKINTVTVLTTYSYDNPYQIPQGMFQLLSESVVKFELLGLSPTEMVQLACQKLKVESLPQELEGLIQARSLGNPLWCIELIDILLDLKYLEIKSAGDDEMDSKQVLSLNPISILDRQASRTVINAMPSSTVISPSPSSIAVKSSLNLPIPESVTGIILTRITNLSATDQMTLKCAAVAGVVFKRDILQHIIPNCVPEKLQQSIDFLIDNDLLECAVAARVLKGTDDMKGDPLTGMLDTECECLNRGAPSKDLKPSTSTRLLQFYSDAETDADSRPSVALSSQHGCKCETLQFIHGYVRDTLYTLWTETQKTKLHKSAAQYFQELAHRCASCGGGPFISTTSCNAQPLPVLTPEFSDDETLAEKSVIEYKHGMGANRSDATVCDDIKTKTEDRLEKIFASNVDRLSMTCYCNSVLEYIYPQLIDHWRCSGNVECLVEALIEGGAAAVVMKQNMEAMSMLKEAELLIRDHNLKLDGVMEGRLYSLIGQVGKSAAVPVFVLLFFLLFQ